MDRLLRILAAVVVGALCATACGSSSEGSANTTEGNEAEPDLLSGVVRYESLAREHQRGDLSYDQNPPAGGAHNPLWHACGMYTVAIPEERAVHSLEHGAIWIAYSPGTDVSALADRVAAESHILVSPVEGMASPIVVTAWEAQLELASLDLAVIDAFVDAFIREGPEGRTPCRKGGVGAEPDQPGPDLDF